MPSIPPEFPFDDKSAHEAADLTNALRERHFKEIQARPSDILSPRPDFESVEHARGQLTGPLREISSDIPMVDVLADVQDFGVLVAYGRMTDGVMTVLRIGKDRTVVPLLPQHGLLEQYQGIGWPFIPPEFNWFRRKFFQSSFDEKALDEVPLQTAQESFFSGLKSFLAARISGVRWWRSRGAGSGSSGGGAGAGGGGGRRGGGSGGGAGSRGTSSAQIWEVHTLASGLTLAYHGTHAARLPVTLPGGFTTPVNVYLPMGTLYLGANAGAGGRTIFDYGVVLNVPSTHPHPVHSTKAF
jgi:hypothetical protein